MALPSGYKKLEYIESDGNQWCNIGVIGQSGISVEAKITWIAGRVFIGSTTANDSTRCFPTFKYGNGNYFGYGYITTYQASKAVVYGTDYTIETSLKVGAQSMKVNGEVIKTTANNSSFNNGFPLYLFAANFGGSASDKGSFRCEYCKVRLNGVLVSDVIPCKNTAGTPGLWDDAKSVFLKSEGSKPFIAGPEVDEPGQGGDQPDAEGNHNTLIGGAAREIETGITLIGGVSREIVIGMVLAGGVAREIEIGQSVETATFSTYDKRVTKTYTYEAGMTWGEFIASGYNDGTFFLLEGFVSGYNSNGHEILLHTGNYATISPSETIEAGRTYQLTT